MSMGSSRREELLHHLTGSLLQEYSLRVILFHQTVAERLGLNVTDHKCLGLLANTGPITAGRLSELTGLSTGAVTTVIDRLEKAGFVRRERDPKDRRRVIVRPLVEKGKREIGPIFESLQQSMNELCSRYQDKELELLIDFLQQSMRIMEEESIRLKKSR